MPTYTSTHTESFIHSVPLPLFLTFIFLLKLIIHLIPCCKDSASELLVNIRSSCINLNVGLLGGGKAMGKNVNSLLAALQRCPVDYSTAVSNCFKEVGGKLILFTADIVQRFSHSSKIIEARGK